MLTRLIQQKIPLGSPVRFLLKTGQEISGILEEIGRDHVTVKTENGLTTILAEVIGLWEILEEVKTSEQENIETKLVEKEEDTGYQSTEGQKGGGFSLN